MTFKALEALDWIKADLGSIPEETTSQMDLLNQAGQFFVATRTWRVYEASGTLDTVIGQDYVDLFDDFRSERSVRVSGTGTQLRKASPEQINEYDAYGSTPTPRLYDIQHRVASNVIIPIIRLSPTPTAVETLYVYYNTDWNELATPGDVVRMTHWMKPLYRQMVVAFARGILENEESGAARLEGELAAVRGGEVFKAVSMRDARLSHGRGMRRRGFVDSANFRRVASPYLDGNTLPPS